MPTPIVMPKLGITMEEGTVVEWPCAVGEHVEQGQVVLIIQTEKAEVEIEASAAGFIRHLFVEPGDTVPCGTLLGALTPSIDEDFDADRFAAQLAEQAEASPPASATPEASAAKALAQPFSLERPSRTAKPSHRSRATTPAARARARRLAVDIARAPGTGPGGRVTRADVDDWSLRLGRRRQVAEGVSLEISSSGEGPAVLLLPGLGNDVSAFAHQIPALRSRFRVYGVNPRGVGASDAPETEAYSVPQAALDAASVSDEPAHLIGASLGAAIAIELALARPERVRSLTLVTPFVLAGARLEAVAHAWGRLAGEVPPSTLAYTLLPWFFSPGHLADGAYRERAARGLASSLARVPPLALRRTIRGLCAWSGTRAQDLGRISVPTLVIAAGEDLLTSDGARIAEAIPDATCLTVPNAGHAVTIEAPDEVTRAILSQLSRFPLSRQSKLLEESVS